MTKSGSRGSFTEEQRNLITSLIKAVFCHAASASIVSTQTPTGRCAPFRPASESWQSRVSNGRSRRLLVRDHDSVFTRLFAPSSALNWAETFSLASASQSVTGLVGVELFCRATIESRKRQLLTATTSNERRVR